MEIEPTDKQLLTVWNIIDGMETGQILVIKDHAPNKPDLFIQCCKYWIDCFKEAEFSNDYTIFKRF